MNPKPGKLLDSVRETIRLKKYSLKVETGFQYIGAKRPKRLPVVLTKSVTFYLKERAPLTSCPPSGIVARNMKPMSLMNLNMSMTTTRTIVTGRGCTPGVR
jgi:hypothetical protein